jgi:hypothetical protein
LVCWGKALSEVCDWVGVLDGINAAVVQQQQPKGIGAGGCTVGYSDSTCGVTANTSGIEHALESNTNRIDLHLHGVTTADPTTSAATNATADAAAANSAKPTTATATAAATATAVALLSAATSIASSGVSSLFVAR